MNTCWHVLTEYKKTCCSLQLLLDVVCKRLKYKVSCRALRGNRIQGVEDGTFDEMQSLIDL